MKPTKKARIEAARELIDSTKMWKEWTPEQLIALTELTGVEIRYAMRKPNPSFPSDQRMLEVITKEWAHPAPWSWRRAIETSGNIDMYLRGKKAAALRQAILEQIESARQELGSACERCGGTHDLTVDHANPAFSVIASEFLGNFSNVLLKDTVGGGGIIADELLLQAWRNHHKKRATYALLCRSCNSTKGAGVAA